MVVIAVVLAWLTVVALGAALCGAAARGDRSALASALAPDGPGATRTPGPRARSVAREVVRSSARRTTAPALPRPH